MNVLLIACIADHYYMKIVDKFQSEIRIPNVCKSNLNFKTEVRKIKLFNIPSWEFLLQL